MGCNSSCTRVSESSLCDDDTVRAASQQSTTSRSDPPSTQKSKTPFRTGDTNEFGFDVAPKIPGDPGNNEERERDAIVLPSKNANGARATPTAAIRVEAEREKWTVAERRENDRLIPEGGPKIQEDKNAWVEAATEAQKQLDEEAKQKEEAKAAAEAARVAEETKEHEEEQRRLQADQKLRQEVNAQLSQCIGVDPAAGAQSVSEENSLVSLAELRQMFPDASEDILQRAAACETLEEAIEMVMDSSL